MNLPRCAGHLAHFRSDPTPKATAQELHPCDSLPWSKMVLVRDCAVPKIGTANFLRKWPVFPALGKIEELLFFIVDLTFHGQWRTSQVQRQAPCTGSFACLGIHSSLANRARATFDLVMGRCRSSVISGHLAYWRRYLYPPEAAAQELQPCDSDIHGLKKKSLNQDFALEKMVPESVKL